MLFGKRTCLVAVAAVAATLQLATSAALADVNPPLAPLGDPPIPPDNKQTAAKVETLNTDEVKEKKSMMVS